MKISPSTNTLDRNDRLIISPFTFNSKVSHGFFISLRIILMGLYGLFLPKKKKKNDQECTFRKIIPQGVFFGSLKEFCFL